MFFRFFLSIVVAQVLLIADANTTSSAMPSTLQNTPSLKSINALPLAKLHRFIAEEIKPANGAANLFAARGYFHTPKRKIPAVIFVTASLDFAVYGRGFDTQSMQETSFVSVNELEALSLYCDGEGETVFLFTDPLCPYCQNLEKALHQHPSSSYRICRIMLALPMHPKAPNAISYISSYDSDKRAGINYAIATGEHAYEASAVDASTKARIKQSSELANMLGIRGTPSAITSDLLPLSIERLYE